ncbi:MAG: single-stranded-DNA-specific exonuclease RecJ [Longimicrobiales bacterium]|nr:single-stranded-DNA-specific exonuclease RecJ [Longimicrobiales bacterium]
MSPSGPSRAEARLRAPDPRWASPRPLEPDSVASLASALGLPESLCAVLVARGTTDVEEAKRFLRPRLEHLSDPASLADGSRAASRIAEAVRAGETILVHGDYDVDGICAAALLTRFLKAQGATVVPFVPHRLRDGYDFSAAGLQAARDAGAGLVVTVDCGTVAHETVAAAAEAGVDVVVTDHHTVGARLPEALAVVNPQRADCPYPDKGLCGAGLAYRVAELVAREVGGAQELPELLDLVALATIADLVPLAGENRVLAHYGLRRMADSRWAGVRALLRVSDVDPAAVTAGQVGFRVAPRINAAGRVGEADDALRLLLTDSDGEAGRLAERLDALNGQRRDEDRRTLDEALDDLGRRFDPDSDFGVVLSGSGWHPGVIGIVASRVVERIHRPVVMISVDGDRARGSARSIPGFHLYEALAECAQHLDRFGGHRQAAGMDVRPGALEAFQEAFNEVARTRLHGKELRPVLRPDVELTLADADLDLVHWLSYLGPHGMGNPGPLFLARRLQVEGARVVGERHLKATLRQGDARVDAIGFGLVERISPERLDGKRYDALFRLERNEWRGRASVQAKLVDLRPADLGGNAP